MANDINTKELERAAEQIQKYQEYIDKLGKDKKTVDNINEQIAALKILREELKKNGEANKDALTKNQTAILKLRQARNVAAKDSVAFLKDLFDNSAKVTQVLDKLSGLYEGVNNRNKTWLESEKKRLETKENITEEERALIKEYGTQITQLDIIAKKEANRKKEYSNYIDIIKASNQMSMTIIDDIMKFTPLGSKSKDRKGVKEAMDAFTEEDSTSVGSEAVIAEGGGVPAIGSDSEGKPLTEDEKTENIKANHQARVQSAVEYAEAAKEIASELDSFLDTIDAQRIQKKQKEHDDEVAALQIQLDNNEISQEQYNEKVSSLDKKLADDKAKIEKEQAIRKKATSIFQVTMDMAVGIMKAWIDVPVWASIAYTAAIAAMGVAQIAAIAAAPLPKARKGGLIVGNSHENGGVLIEAEGGEAILSREAVEAFPGMVQLMNAAASGYIYDGGYAARSVLRTAGDDFAGADGKMVNIDYKKLAVAITESLKEMKIYVAVTDINDGLKQYVQLDDMAKL